MNPLERDCFAGFKPADYPCNLNSDGYGSNDPVFEKLITAARPSLIVEVGTWKGASAIHMAKICDRLKLACPVVCVDTWLGAGTQLCDKASLVDLQLRHGYPTIYYYFLANVMRSGMEARIKPFPQTSLIAARWLAAHNILADLIYVDANHDAPDVLADLEAYWPLVRPGGFLLGDDYTWATVQAAVRQFLEHQSLGSQLTLSGANKYYVKK